MKNFMTIALLLVMVNTYAQQVDSIKTTKVETVTDTVNGEITSKKIKTITLKEQAVKTDPADKGKLNADRIFPPTKVKKTVMVDYDADPFYDEKTTLKYFELNNDNYVFRKSNDGFIMNVLNKDEEVLKANARQTKSGPYYVVNSNEFDGIGFFNKEKKFVLEFYNQKTDKLETIEFAEK
ncbi:hypothetical protein [Postechiella marina]